MELDCPHLSLARHWAGEDEDKRIALVDSLDALRLCGAGAFETISASDALWNFERESCRLGQEVVDFAIRVGLASPWWGGCDDDDPSDLVAQGIARGDVVGLRKGTTVPATKPTVEQRRLVAQIDALMRGRLNQGGRQYRLVAGDDLDDTPDRDSYVVVPRDEAGQILDRMANEAGVAANLATLLGQARDKLTPDWRPPLAPDGLILLRRSQLARNYTSDTGPALTPSQIRKLAAKDWIEIEVVEEDGTPYAGGYRIELTDGTVPEGNFDGNGLFSNHNLDPGQCKLFLTEKHKKKVAGTDVPADTEEQSVATRVRMVGMIFDANKCFLLPQALPGIKTIIAMHKQEPSAEVLIVGHAGGDEDLAGADIAFDRAQMLGAYLKSMPNVWLNWFGPDKNPRSRWGTREIQLMLSVLPEGGAPLYQGYASGVTDDKTTAAIKAFQEHAGLPTDGTANFETRKALVEAYMGLEDTTLGQDITPIAHGCEGHFDDTATTSGVESDDRRLEVFFFKKSIEPRPDKTISSAGTTLYPTWLAKVVQTKDFEHHGIHVQIVDAEKQPAPFATVHLKGPTSTDATADEHGFVSFFGLKQGEYTISSEKNGYKIGLSKLNYPTAKTVTGYAKTEGA